MILVTGEWALRQRARWNGMLSAPRRRSAEPPSGPDLKSGRAEREPRRFNSHPVCLERHFEAVSRQVASFGLTLDDCGLAHRRYADPPPPDRDLPGRTLSP